MTNSAKWAYYAPANIGVEAVFGSLTALTLARETGSRHYEYVSLYNLALMAQVRG